MDDPAIRSLAGPRTILIITAACGDRRLQKRIRPSEQLEKPYVIAGVDVIATDAASVVQGQLQGIRRRRAVSPCGRQLGVRDLDATDELADQLLAAAASAQVDEMLTSTALGHSAKCRTTLTASTPRRGRTS
jgi:hypothetical protein